MDEAESTGPAEQGDGRDRAREMMAADRASAALGMQVLDVGTGTARVRMVVREDMVNGYDIAHGGLVFALADTAFACACNSWGDATVAAGAEIVFVAAARAGDELVAEAAARTRFGRYGVYDVTVYRVGEAASGETEFAVVAEFRGRSHRLGPR